MEIDWSYSLKIMESATEKMDRLCKKLEEKPIIRTVSGSTVLTGSTGLVEIQERPAVGRIWNILKVGVLNVDGHTALSGVIVDVYSSALANPSTATIDNVIVSGGTGNVPSITWYSRGVEWCLPGEEIFGQVYGGTTGQQIVLVCRVAEYNMPTQIGYKIP